MKNNDFHPHIICGTHFVQRKHNTYTHTCIHTHTYRHTDRQTRQTDIHTYIHTYIHSHTYIHTYMAACLPACMPAYLPTNMPTYLAPLNQKTTRKWKYDWGEFPRFQWMWSPPPQQTHTLHTHSLKHTIRGERHTRTRLEVSAPQPPPLHEVGPPFPHLYHSNCLFQMSLWSPSYCADKLPPLHVCIFYEAEN